MNIFKRIIKKIIKIIEKKITPLPKILRNDDVYLVSFPRSGNTWLSFLIANVISDYLDLNMEVNFNNIHFFVPDIHVNRDIPLNLQFPPFKRIIKSHYRFTSYYPHVLFLVRDPCDVMISHYYYRKRLGEFSGDISSFIRDEKYGISAWVSHSESWLNRPYASQRVQLFFYEKFKENPERELRRLFQLLGFNLSDEIIKKAIEKSNFENMSRLEDETKPYSWNIYKTYRFMRKGVVGQSEEELNEKDLEYIKETAGKTMKKLNYL